MNHLYRLVFIASICFLLQSCGASQTTVSSAEPASATKSSAQPKVQEAQTASADDAAQADVNAPDLVPETAHADSQTADVSDEGEPIPPDAYRCEVKISLLNMVYTAAAVSPTLEESRDNAIGEACSVPCADQIEQGNAATGRQFSDDEYENAIEACMENCADDAEILAAACWQNGENVYNEGEWSETNDAVPTSGAEILDDQQVTE